MSNIADVLKALEEINEKSSFNIFIPSLKREVKFKPLTTKQQQSLYTCVKDNFVYSTRFVIVTSNIIIENCYEPDVLKDLTIIDRIVILLALRKSVLGSGIFIEKNGTTYEVHYDNCLELTTTLETPPDEIVSVGPLQVELQVLKLLDLFNQEKELRGSFVTEPAATDTILEQLLINETCKVIKSISIVTDNGLESLNYDQLTWKEKAVAVSNLPAEVMIGIQNYSKSISSILTELTTVYLSENQTTGFDITVDFFLSN